MEMILDVVATVCIGLMIGTEFAVSVFINPILTKLGDVAEAKATRLFGQKLGRAMPFWYVASFLLLIAEMALRRHQPGIALLGTASVLWAAVIVGTLLLLVPINNRIVTMTSEVFTDELRRQHRLWDLVHRGRVAALTAAMICLLIGIRL